MEQIPNKSESFEQVISIYDRVVKKLQNCIEMGIELPNSISRFLKLSAVLLTFITADSSVAQHDSNQSRHPSSASVISKPSFDNSFGISTFMYESKDNWREVMQAGGENKYARLKNNLRVLKLRIDNYQQRIGLESDSKHEYELDLAQLQDIYNATLDELASHYVDETQWQADSIKYHHMTVLGNNVRRWMLEAYRSEVFYNRMINLGLNRADIDKRIQNLQAIPVEFSTEENKNLLSLDENTNGFYDGEDYFIGMQTKETSDSLDIKSTYAEEYDHASTEADELLSDYEKQMLLDSFKLSPYFKKEYNAYLQRPTERRAKLTALRLFLSNNAPTEYRLNYGESINIKHVKWLRQKGKEFIESKGNSAEVPYNVMVFILTTPDDWELIKIFNTLP